jgi:hypothetical protein
MKACMVIGGILSLASRVWVHSPWVTSSLPDPTRKLSLLHGRDGTRFSKMRMDHPPPYLTSIRSTRHGQWPEVSLVIYSWSFYKILDSTWYRTNRSKRLLKALVGIWSGCGSNVDLVNTPAFRVYRRSAPIITGYPYVYREGFIAKEDSDDSEKSTDKSTDKETPAEHDQELAVRSTV